MVHKTLISAWPLFFGIALMMVANGLQGTLLGVRASAEGFNTTIIGLIMSLYYLGFLAGSYMVPKLVAKVGHIRVFAALASLASTTVLFHGIFTNEWIWALIRVFTGFSYAGLFIVVESWLNNMATNKTRGQLLAIYLVVSYVGMVSGQFLLNLANPEQIELFVLTSVLVSLALLPISLSTRPAPAIEEPEHISLRRLYVMSPLGLFGALTVGLANGAMFGIGAVYATETGMSYVQVSTFMAAYILGGVIFQMPIGWLSDKYDRRRVLIVVSFLTALTAMACFFLSETPGLNLYLAVLIFGGLSLSIYPLCLAHTNDHLTQRQIIAAGSSLILVNGMGSSIGPLLTSAAMTLTTIQAFFPILAAIFVIIFIFGVVRTQMRPPVPMDEQGDYHAMPARSSPLIWQIAEETSETMKHMEDDDEEDDEPL